MLSTRRLIKDVGSKLLWRFERTMASHSKVGDAPVHDRRDFPWLTGLEETAPSIRRELDACLVPARGFAPENWTSLPDPFPAWS